MVKAKRKIGVNSQYGGFDIEWETLLRDPEVDFKFLKNIIDSYNIGLEIGEHIPVQQVRNLLKKLRDYGHLVKLKEKKYLDEYQKLVDYVKAEDAKPKFFTGKIR